MHLIDVFNGDADGLCALHQLRLAEPADSELVTGPKRDISLLKRVKAGAGDRITVKWGQTPFTFISRFLGLPTPFDAARLCPNASIASLNRLLPNAQPLCVQSRISARSP